MQELTCKIICHDADSVVITKWYMSLATTTPLVLPLYSSGAYDFTINQGDGNYDDITGNP